MAAYKISLLGLFLIILGALIISILVGNWFQTSKLSNSKKEGLESYYYGTAPVSKVYIPYYSGKVGGNYGKNVYLVYDCIYYDADNANIIEVDGYNYNGDTTKGNGYYGNAYHGVDTKGDSILNLFVANPNKNDSVLASINGYSLTDKSLDDVKGTIDAKDSFLKSYSEMVYQTQSQDNDYFVFVLPWKDSTYIHIIDKKESINVITTWFGPGNKTGNIAYSNSPLPFSKENPNYNANPMINLFVALDEKNDDIKVYQLSDCIFYDNSTGVLVIYKNKKYDNFTIYNQNGQTISESDISTQKRSTTGIFSSWTNAYDAYGNLMVLYINNGPTTTIALIQPDGYNGYTLFNVQRFNLNGLDSGPVMGNTGASNFNLSLHNTETYYDKDIENPSESRGSNNMGRDRDNKKWNEDNWTNGSDTNGGPTSMMNDYYRWFYYWATQGLNKNPNGPNFNYSDDYIMKTQIVPPVCPSCPSCPATGTCTNCGGNGGSGTKTGNGGSLAGDDNSNFNFAGNGYTLSKSANTIGGVLNNAINQPANIISGIDDSISDAASGAVNIAKDTASGASNLATKTASGAVGLGKDIVGGTVGLGREIVGGTVGLGREIVGGIANLGQGPTQIKGQGQGVDRMGYSNSYGGPTATSANPLLPKNSASNVDISNMYGAMPNKGNSNYMPLTSDFSKFGR